MNIHQAVQRMRQGDCVARPGWRGAYCYLASPNDLTAVQVTTSNQGYVARPWTPHSIDIRAADFFVIQKGKAYA